LAGVVRHDVALGAARVLDDLDRALEHDEEAEVPVALGEQHLALLDRSGMAPRGQRGQILGAENGKRDFLISGHAPNLASVATPPDPAWPAPSRRRGLLRLFVQNALVQGDVPLGHR
jgi:hypothetical protein